MFLNVCRYDPEGRPIKDDPNDPYNLGNKAYTVRSDLEGRNSNTMLTIGEISLDVAGKYTVKVTNGDKVEEESFGLRVKAKPKVSPQSKQKPNTTHFIDCSLLTCHLFTHEQVSVAVVNSQPLYQVGKEYRLKCNAKGNPKPTVSWLFKPCSGYNQCHNSSTIRTVPTTYVSSEGQKINLCPILKSL